ncbi:MAG: L,D-transpeptidase family protein [Thermoanaerobaculia bacterium]
MKRISSAFPGVFALLVVIGPAAAQESSRVPQYDWLALHLPKYRELAGKQWPGPLPAVQKLSPGDPYPGVTAMASILSDLGDLPAGVRLPDGTYGGALVDAMERFQERHGLTPDGIVGPGTFRALNVPYASRLAEVEHALAWLATIPHPAGDVVVVNIPAFELLAWKAEDHGKRSTFAMRVVVGSAAHSATPVLGGTISYLVFSPYWYVPRSIVLKEMLPAYAKDAAYFQKHDLEFAASNDDAAPAVPVTAQSVARLRAGELGVRQKPGSRNSLGRVKFIFPNSESVFLHDTPARSLFARDRRDFSHGCVRVEDPQTLAEFLLRAAPGWDRPAIEKAMAAGRPQVVPVKPAVPVWLLYATAIASFDGRIWFFEDVYGRREPAGGPER